MAPGCRGRTDTLRVKRTGFISTMRTRTFWRFAFFVAFVVLWTTAVPVEGGPWIEPGWLLGRGLIDTLRDVRLGFNYSPTRVRELALLLLGSVFSCFFSWLWTTAAVPADGTKMAWRVPVDGGRVTAGTTAAPAEGRFYFCALWVGDQVRVGSGGKARTVHLHRIFPKFETRHPFQAEVPILGDFFRTSKLLRMRTCWWSYFGIWYVRTSIILLR